VAKTGRDGLRVNGTGHAIAQGTLAHARAHHGVPCHRYKLVTLRRGVPPDCAWLLHDIIWTDSERMVDVERSMRDAPG
jgi:hypothetical protein